MLVQAGRVHLYEGHSPVAVTTAVSAYAKAGIRALIFTNASGSIRPRLEPGMLALVSDYMNFTSRGIPLPVGAPQQRVRRIDPDVASMAKACAREGRIELAEATYCGLLGPSYETAAEIRMLQRLGTDLVGMSTVLELEAAQSSGLKAIAISTVTNYATGLSPEPLSHKDVLEAGSKASANLSNLLSRLCRRLDAEPATLFT